MTRTKTLISHDWVQVTIWKDEEDYEIILEILNAYNLSGIEKVPIHDATTKKFMGYAFYLSPPYYYDFDKKHIEHDEDHLMFVANKENYLENTNQKRNEK